MSFTTESGMDIPRMASSAMAAYCHALGVSPESMRNLGESWEKAWLILANKFDSLTGSLEGKTGMMAAEIVYGVWKAAFESLGGVEPTRWDKLTLDLQIAWEAATRHLSLVIEAEEPLNWAAEEANWKNWAERRLDKLTAPGAK